MISTSGRVAGLRRLGGGADHRPHLHLVDLRIEEGEADAARAEHRVGLLEVADDLGRLARIGEPIIRGGLEPAHLGLEMLEREKLVKRRVEQPHRHRQAAHLVQDRGEVGSLKLSEMLECLVELAARALELGRRRPAVAGRLDDLGAPPARRGDEHAAHELAAVLAEEHVLGAAEPDSLGAERARLGRVLRRCRRWP